MLRTGPFAALEKTPVIGSHSCPAAAEHLPAVSKTPPACVHSSPKSPVRSAALGTPARAVPVLRVSVALVIEKEEGLVLTDGSADRAAELVVLVRGDIFTPF